MLEFSEVVFMDDLNKSIETIIQFKRDYPDLPLLQEQIEALNLYYVAASRAKISLINATYL